ncbi:MAG: S8 family serine peptidase [Muribaculaceae bacterium]|nr:S8 family serine peptidase [Muribaculaceae bacterium]
MRKFFLLLMTLGVSLAMMAQDKLSAPTQVFLQQRANAAAQAPNGKGVLAQPKAINGVEYIECFIDLNGASTAEIEALGVKVTSTFKGFVAASVPVDKIEAVARLKSVKQVGIARNARLFTDVAKTYVNADKAWDGTNYGLPQGYTGQGVVLGIIDDGIQFNHRAFLDDNGNTRVKAVYMPNASSANGGTKATIDGVQLMGYQYTTASQIGNLTCDDSGESHGTHTTGCAAGSHVGNYAGMAPEADLVLCGCGSQLTETAIVSSAKYIANYAKNVLGKPCVISISLGSDIGPHDGTSAISRAYTEVAETYGAVILLAAGNEADITGAAVKTLSSSSDYMMVRHNVSYTYYGGSCDIWNSTGDQLQVKVVVGSNQSDWMTSGTYNNVSVSGGVDQYSGRYNLYIESSNSSAYYIIKGSAGNTVHVYTDCYYSELGTSGSVSGYTLTPGTYENSMCDDMCATKVIGVGAMCTRNTSNGSYATGDIAYFSSYGTDCNGIDQPFITAPGHYNISSVNGYDSGQSSTWTTTYNGTTYKWGQMSGTSMATPTAAGVVVLYLQADPTLDVDRVKDVIANTATQFTNPTSPAKQRGHGIINALAGIEYILNNQGPVIKATPDEVNFEGYVGETYTQTINVKGYNLTGNISIAKSGANVYSVTPTTISADDANNGVDVTVTYAPTAAGNTNATLTLTSNGAEAVTVPVTGVAAPRVPTVIVNPETLDFKAALSSTISKTIDVTGLFLTGDVTVTLNDQNGVFSVSPTTIPKNSISENTPVQVTVTFTSGDEEATYSGSVAFTTPGGETKTVALNAQANDGGTAADPYLNIAKYATIDEAGATVSGMSTIYKYTEDGDAAWLTVCNYGAFRADDTQNWYETSDLSQYTNTWSATDVFQGDDAYFGSNNSYSIYGNGSQTFYVTNCVQAKAYVKGGSSSSSNAKLTIYECTLNGDGSITPSNTATDTKQSNNGVITSAGLDPTKIYKVQLTGGGSYPDLLEIGFKTELNQPMIVADPSNVTITSAPGETGTATISVRGKMLPGDVTVALNDPDNVFTVSATTISKADAEAGTQLTVTFESDEEASCQGTITLTSGTLTTTVNLTGRCNDGGTASDAYLNIAKYATIDDAGASVNYMTSIYNYAEYAADNCGWLTISTYGAKQTDANQNWLETSSLNQYNNSWTATDIFPIDDAFFGTNQAYGIYGSGSQTFYVTNCTQAKALVKDGSSSKATLAVYECTVGVNGQPVAASTPFDSQQGGASGLAVITSATLDASKIYKVVLTGGGSYPDLLAVGFQTPIVVEEETTLAYILENGVNNQEYTVSNDLIMVDVADVENYAFLTDGEGNWIRIAAPDNDVFDVFAESVLIKGGTLKGTLSGIELNPVLTVTVQPEGKDPISPDYVNYIEPINLAESFTLVSNQVVDVTGWWNAAEGALRAYQGANGSAQGQSMTIDYTWGANTNTMVNGQRYTVRCAINLKEPWHNEAGIAPLDYDYDFQNYIGYALRMPGTPTAVNTIGMDSYNEIVNVYNAQGQLIRRNVKAGEATQNLPAGIYVVGNKKVVVK